MYVELDGGQVEVVRRLSDASATTREISILEHKRIAMLQEAGMRLDSSSSSSFVLVTPRMNFPI
jgi:hypothetical protein